MQIAIDWRKNRIVDSFVVKKQIVVTGKHFREVVGHDRRADNTAKKAQVIASWPSYFDERKRSVTTAYPLLFRRFKKGAIDDALLCRIHDLIRPVIKPDRKQ